MSTRQPRPGVCGRPMRVRSKVALLVLIGAVACAHREKPKTPAPVYCGKRPGQMLVMIISPRAPESPSGEVIKQCGGAKTRGMVSLLMDVAADGRIQRVVREEISHETDEVASRLMWNLAMAPSPAVHISYSTVAYAATSSCASTSTIFS